MAAALTVFLLGIRTYRYYVTAGERGLFARAAEAFAEWRSRRKALQHADRPAAEGAPGFRYVLCQTVTISGSLTTLHDVLDDGTT
jgi:peptide/histidine transporter 3/4